MNEKHVGMIQKLNRQGFGSNDEFNYKRKIRQYVKKGHYILCRNSEGKIVGYTLYAIRNNRLEIDRRAVLQKGGGYGIKLAKKAKTISNRMGLIMFTYASINNLASINTNIKAGLFVSKIDNKWVHLVSEREKNDIC